MSRATFLLKEVTFINVQFFLLPFKDFLSFGYLIIRGAPTFFVLPNVPAVTFIQLAVYTA